MRYLVLLPAALALTVAPRLSAQSAAATPGPRFGLVAGINLADFSGNDVGDTKMKTGFVGGGMLTLSLTPMFDFQPELLYSMKGTKGTDEQSGTELKAKLNYIEIPLLVRLNVPTSGQVKPFLLAGPTLNFQASCKLEGSQGGATASVNCDDAGADPNSFDAGGLLGGGLAFDLGGRTVSIGARYEFGFNKVFKDVDAKNRVLSFVGTFEFPIGR